MTFHDFIFSGYVFLLIFGSLGPFCLTLFNYPYIVSYLSPILFSWLVALIDITLLFGVMKFIHKKWKVGDKKQSRNSLLIGLGGSFIAGIVPRIAAFCFPNGGKYFEIIGYLTYVCLFVILLFHLFFVYPAKREYSTAYSINDKVTWAIGILHFFITPVTLFSSIAFENPKRSGIIICELMFPMICASTMVEFVRVARGYLKWRRPEGIREIETSNPFFHQEADVQELVMKSKSV